MPQKCLKSVRKCCRKSQTAMPFTQSFVQSQTKQKKVIAHGDCQEFSFLYRGTVKQMKQKRSTGNVLHLFRRLSVLLHRVSKKQHRMKKNGIALDVTLNKNAVISKIKKRRSQLPKRSEKMP